MDQVNTIGFETAKHVFQVHGTDAQGRVFRRKLRRKEVISYFASLPAERDRDGGVRRRALLGAAAAGAGP